MKLRELIDEYKKRYGDEKIVDCSQLDTEGDIVGIVVDENNYLMIEIVGSTLWIPRLLLNNSLFNVLLILDEIKYIEIQDDEKISAIALGCLVENVSFNIKVYEMVINARSDPFTEWFLKRLGKHTREIKRIYCDEYNQETKNHFETITEDPELYFEIFKRDFPNLEQLIEDYETRSDDNKSYFLHMFNYQEWMEENALSKIKFAGKTF